MTIRVAEESTERPGGLIELDAVKSAEVREGIAAWRRACGTRRFPSRADISPRAIAGILRHTVLLRVIDGGADYEYRIIGDAHVEAYGFSMQGRPLSEMEPHAPGHGAILKRLYGRVVRKREPFALHGWLERGDAIKQYIFSESVFAPLGPDDETVDHVLNFSVYNVFGKDAKQRLVQQPDLVRLPKVAV